MFTFVLVTRVAVAASCCGGSSAAVPTRPADCDQWVVGIGVAGETALGRWDAAGASVPTAIAESTLTTTVGGGYRWAPWGGAVAELPVQLNWKTTGDDATWGGGLGDAHLGVFFDPLDEPAETPVPVPILSVGARLPSGRAWTESTDPLLADVTGLPDPALTAALSLERANGRVPYSAGVDVELPLGAEAASPPTLGLSAAVGFSIDGRWIILATARHALTPGDPAGPTRTTAGGRLMRNEPRSWRAWLGAESDLPGTGLGQSNLQNVRATAGFLFVR